VESNRKLKWKTDYKTDEHDEVQLGRMIRECSFGVKTTEM